MNVLWLKSLTPGHLALSSDMFEEVMNSDRVILHFGLAKMKLKVVGVKDFPKDTVGLPYKLSDTYTVPTNLLYECILKEGGFYIGPVIAYVVLGRLKQLTRKKLSAFLPRVKEYEQIKGLIYVCTTDSINEGNAFVEGYYYDPCGPESGYPWKYGRFPLPNAVFNRSFLSQDRIKALRGKIGDTIFNSYWYALNKWLIWKILSTNCALKRHLPYTEKFISSKQLYNLLNKYDSVYIKPFNQSRGRGVKYVTKRKKGILVIDENKKTYNLKDENELNQFFKSNVTSSSIVQQAVPFKQGNRFHDFRIFLQKDENKQWAFKGSVLKISQEGSIITNTKGREKILDGRQALLTIYKMTEEDALRTEAEMTDLVTKAVRMYEKRGLHIADLAADVILDASRHLWLLELQLNYAAERADDLPPAIFKEIMAAPFRYAKALSGFSNH